MGLLADTMHINLTRICFVLLASSTCAIGLLINIAEKYMPVVVVGTYRYGKFAVVTDHALLSKLEVPKRWFKHFYVFAAPASSFVLALTILRYICEIPTPRFVTWLLDLQMGSRRKALVSPETTMLATMLLSVQCWKRLYETRHVSVFSDGKLGVIHYIVGFGHYLGTLTSLIGESEGFVVGSSGVLRWDRLTTVQYCAAIVFLLASWEQLRTNFILANLRRDSCGNVVTKAHKIPRGRLFRWISGPLQFNEIIMYTMLSIVLWRSSTYHYVTAWVVVNQIETAILNHRWYVQKFEDYPKERKILVPFLY